MSRSALATRLSKLESERTPDPSKPLVVLSDHPPENTPAEDQRRIDEATRSWQRRLYLVTLAEEQPTDEQWAKAYCG